MNIEERILNDSSCSAYVDKSRGYVEIAFKDGAYWGYEQGCEEILNKVMKFFLDYGNVQVYANKIHNELIKYLEG